MPALLPGHTFIPVSTRPYFQLVAILGAAPNVFWIPNGYAPKGEYERSAPAEIHAELIPSASGSGPVDLVLTLPYIPPTGDFTLVLTVGVLMETVGLRGSIEVVKRAGYGKILAAV